MDRSSVEFYRRVHKLAVGLESAWQELEDAHETGAERDAFALYESEMEQLGMGLVWAAMLADTSWTLSPAREMALAINARDNHSGDVWMAKLQLALKALLEVADDWSKPWRGRIGSGPGSGKPRDGHGEITEIVPVDQVRRATTANELSDGLNFLQVWILQEALKRAAALLDPYPRHRHETDWPTDAEGRPLDLPEPERASIGRRGPRLAEVLEVATPRQGEALDTMMRYVYDTDDPGELRCLAAAEQYPDSSDPGAALRNLLDRLRANLEHE